MLLLYFLLHMYATLIGLVKTPSEQVVVEQTQVVRCNVQVGVGQSDKHGVVDDVVVDTFKDGSLWLSGGSGVLTSDLKRSVGDVELTDPSDELYPSVWCDFDGTKTKVDLQQGSQTRWQHL